MDYADLRAPQTPSVISTPFVPPVCRSPYVPFQSCFWPEGQVPFVPLRCSSTAAIPQTLPPFSPWVRHCAIPGLQIDPGLSPIWPPDTGYLPNPTHTHTPLDSIMIEPGTFPAEPWGTPVPIRLHPQLLYNPYDPLVPVLQWDIIHRAEQARALTGRGLYVPAKLSEQATLPAAPRIWIFSDHFCLATWMQHWGPIVVEGGKITVRDVLDAIWEYFQQPLTENEYRQIEACPNALANLMIAARQRVRDSYELPSVTRRNGFKRIDILGGHRRFQGLRVVAYANMTWRAFLGLLPGPLPRFT